MPPKPKAPKIRWRGGGSRVDEELDAVDYADTYDDEYVEPVQARPKPSLEKPKPLPKEEPKPVEKPKENPKPQPEPEEDPFAKEPVLETFDNWEAAMDALDKEITKEEEQRAAQRNSKK